MNYIKKHKKLLLFFGLLLVLSGVSSLSPKLAEAAEANSFGDLGAAITIHLTGNIPANISVTADRTQVQEAELHAYPGLENNYSLTSSPVKITQLNSNTYGLSDIQPFYKTDGSTGVDDESGVDCISLYQNGGLSTGLYNFTIKVTSNGQTIGQESGNIKCNNQDISVPLSGTTSTSTPTPKSASVTGNITITQGGTTGPALNPPAPDSPVITLNPGNNTLRSIGSNGSYQFCNLTQGSYTLQGDLWFNQGFGGIIFHTPLVLKAGNNTDNINVNYDKLTNNSPTITIDQSQSGTCTTPGTTPTTTTSASSQTPTCENNGGPLAWFLCKIYEGAADFSNFMLTQLIQPLLRSDPVSIDPTQPTYRIWSNFRIYGNIVLVIALLVIVFGEVIGGGIVDAYTAKKMLPRILIAAILINLSIYIVALMVDVSNILGGGIGELLTAPLGKAAEFQFSISGSAQTGFITLAGGSLAASSVFLGGVTGAVSIAIGAASSALPLILLFIVMPAALSLVAAFVTIILRQALIIFLVLVSPVAFALYCLPNTQQVFKRWWDLLWRTLMVYPIIMIIFAVADILSVTLLRTGTSNCNLPLLAQPASNCNLPLLAQPESFFSNGILIPIIAFAALFLPLLMIPFAFKMAGGALGKIHETLTSYSHKGQEAIKGNPNDQNSLRNKVKGGFKNAFNAKASDRLAVLNKSTLLDQGFDANGNPLPAGRNSRGLRRRLVTAQMFGLNLTDLERKRAEQNEIFDKQTAGKVAIGGDSLERAFFARRFDGPERSYQDYNGNTRTLHTGSYYSSYRDSDGSFREFSPGIVSRSHSMYDGNESKVQSLIKYETGKVNNDQDFYGTDSAGQVIYDPSQIGSRINPELHPMGSFLGNLPKVMSEARLSPNSAAGASIGSFFATQTQRKELKHTKLSPDGAGWKQDSAAFVQDWAENMGTYAASTSKTSPIKRLTSIYRELSSRDQASLSPTELRSVNDLKSIARGLDFRLRSGQGIASENEDGQPIPASSQAPARVNDAIREFIDTVNPPATP